MSRPTISIQAKTTNKKQKSKQWSATLLSMVTCDRLRDLDKGSATRPVFLEYAASIGVHRAFTMNLRMGETASQDSRSSLKVQCMKSDGYCFAPVQRHGDTVRQTVFIPHLYDLDPGSTDPDLIRLIVQPPAKLLDAHVPDPAIKSDDIDPRALSFYAQELVARLDTRSRAPILTSPLFKVALLCDMLRAGLASFTRHDGFERDTIEVPEWARSWERFESTGLAGSGYARPLAVHAKHADFEAILRDTVHRYMQFSKKP